MHLLRQHLSNLTYCSAAKTESSPWSSSLDWNKVRKSVMHNAWSSHTLKFFFLLFFCHLKSRWRQMKEGWERQRFTCRGRLMPRWTAPSDFPRVHNLSFRPRRSFRSELWLDSEVQRTLAWKTAERLWHVCDAKRFMISIRVSFPWRMVNQDRQNKR